MDKNITNFTIQELFNAFQTGSDENNSELNVALEKLRASDLPLVMSGSTGERLLLKWKTSERINDPDAAIRAIIGDDIPYELSFSEYGHES